MNDGDYPCILPVNFGFEMKAGKLCLYFHGSDQGSKHEIIRRDPHVSLFFNRCREYSISPVLIRESYSGGMNEIVREVSQTRMIGGNSLAGRSIAAGLGGSYQSQMNFHKILEAWLAKERKRLLYISTANVFDGSLSKPWTEYELPVPKSAYGSFKRDCEIMPGKMLGEQLIIFRLAAVWSSDCPRIQQLKQYSCNGETYRTYPDYRINVTLAEQIGNYAKYVLDNDLRGIFHVGTADTVNYFSFEQMVCERLKIGLPQFTAETEGCEKVFAILPSRKEIPDELQMSVSDVLAALKI